MSTRTMTKKHSKFKTVLIVLSIFLGVLLIFSLIWGLTGRREYKTTFLFLDAGGQPLRDTEISYSSRTLFEWIFVPEDERGVTLRTDSEGRCTLNGCRRGLWYFKYWDGESAHTIWSYRMGFQLDNGELTLRFSSSDSDS